MRSEYEFFRLGFLYAIEFRVCRIRVLACCTAVCSKNAKNSAISVVCNSCCTIIFTFFLKSFSKNVVILAFRAITVLYNVHKLHFLLILAHTVCVGRLMLVLLLLGKYRASILRKFVRLQLKVFILPLRLPKKTTLKKKLILYTSVLILVRIYKLDI